MRRRVDKKELREDTLLPVVVGHWNGEIPLSCQFALSGDSVQRINLFESNAMDPESQRRFENGVDLLAHHLAFLLGLQALSNLKQQAVDGSSQRESSGAQKEEGEPHIPLKKENVVEHSDTSSSSFASLQSVCYWALSDAPNSALDLATALQKQNVSNGAAKEAVAAALRSLHTSQKSTEAMEKYKMGAENDVSKMEQFEIHINDRLQKVLDHQEVLQNSLFSICASVGVPVQTVETERDNPPENDEDIVSELTRTSIEETTLSNVQETSLIERLAGLEKSTETRFQGLEASIEELKQMVMKVADKL